MNQPYFIQENFGRNNSFQWSEVEGEGRYFRHNNGNDPEIR